VVSSSSDLLELVGFLLFLPRVPSSSSFDLASGDFGWPCPLVLVRLLTDPYKTQSISALDNLTIPRLSGSPLNQRPPKF